MEMLKKLKAKQQALNMTDLAFAKELNVSRPLWSLTRRGKQRIGPKVITGTMQRFPDLIPDVLKYLQEGE